MPFGLTNAPATFQRALDIILACLPWKTCLIYLVDVIVFSRSVTDHLRQVNNVLQLLRKAGITLKLLKCAFFQSRVDYLGHVISPGKLAVASHNTNAFRETVFPQETLRLRSFLGAANVYRRFVKGYSRISRPINRMLSKDAHPNWRDPTAEQKQAFETLKEKPGVATYPISSFEEATLHDRH